MNEIILTTDQLKRLRKYMLKSGFLKSMTQVRKKTSNNLNTKKAAQELFKSIGVPPELRDISDLYGSDASHAVFETIDDFIRHLNLDMTLWVNAEYKKYRRKKTFENAKVTLKHIPRSLKQFIVKCPSGHKFTPDFLEKRNITPVFQLNDGNFWRQGSGKVNCPVCNDSTEVIFPVTEKIYGEGMDVYGDEAFRTVDNKTVFVYSFVSFGHSSVDKNNFEKEFLAIKKMISPKYNPNDWVLHMTELLHSDKRKLNDKLSHLNEKQVVDAIDKILKLIKTYSDKNILNLCSAVSMVDEINLKKHKKLFFQEEIYATALLEIITLLTEKGHAPKFYFERTGNDGWAKNVLDGIRITLLWPFITHCNPIKSPEFVEPSYSLYLEVADIVCYIVARHLFCIGKRAEGFNIETKIPTSQLGNVLYLLTDSRGNVPPHHAKEFPDIKMFKGTSWEKYI